MGACALRAPVHVPLRQTAYSPRMPALPPKLSCAVAWLLLAYAPVCAAQGPVQATGDYLARMDADRDGRVSLPEYQDWLSYAFDAMDRNRDATLTPDELPGGKGRAVGRVEYRNRLADTFRRQDADRDGYLSARELAAPPR